MAEADESDADLIMVQVRLPRELIRQIDHFRIDHDLFRARATELILRAGLARIAASRSTEGDRG